MEGNGRGLDLARRRDGVDLVAAENEGDVLATDAEGICVVPRYVLI